MFSPSIRPTRAALPASLFASMLAVALSSCTATGGATTAPEAVVASAKIGRPNGRIRLDNIVY
jgi:hypothetical protein